MDTRRLVFGLVSIALVALLLYVFHLEPRLRKGASSHQMAVDSFFLALIFVMGLVPQFGYIEILPGLSFTLIHIPVLIGAYLYGAKKGTLYGFFFGLTSNLGAVLQPAGFNAFFVYPWVSLPARMLFGFLAGLLFHLMRKDTKLYKSALAIGGTSFLLTCVHTILVFLDLYLFFPAETNQILYATSSIGTALSALTIAVVAIGMAGEATLAAIVVPAVGKATRKFAKG
ncbi:MAG: ECF transporter S component [Bacilli bacterium]|jgi:uncharacterized membrane protein|nr:ECF transporter S component [Bacilli bacterium]